MKKWVLSCSFRHFIFIVTLLFFISSCTKDDEKQPLNIELWHAPLQTIKSNINGKWELRVVSVCGSPSFCAAKFGPGENVWMFSQNAERLKQVYKGAVNTDTTLLWPRRRTIGDTTYLLSYYTKQGGPEELIVNKIRNDTLILIDNATDFNTYFLIKQP